MTGGQGVSEQDGVSVRIRGSEGWAVRGAILTVMDLSGQQAGHAAAGEDGVAAAGPLPPGTYTAIVTAPGYKPAARTVLVPASGRASLGVITVPRAAGAELPPPGTWSIDPVHSSITIYARHLGLARIRGQVTECSGEIEIAGPVERSAVRARMQAASIDTGSNWSQTLPGGVVVGPVLQVELDIEAVRGDLPGL